jgi:hypothetical protein
MGIVIVPFIKARIVLPREILAINIPVVNKEKDTSKK